MVNHPLLPLLPHAYHLSDEVARARASQLPIVALESTVITHGLPYPDNLALARDMEREVRQGGATPATIAVLDGRVAVGLLPEQVERLASDPAAVKVSARDFGPAVAARRSGGTTVAATLLAAHTAGIHVFATGGIGGVHRDAPFDVSADLQQLARTPVVVVCAGAKAILDLPATLEMLETLGVPVVGYQTAEFPAFYSRSSGLPVSARAASAQEVVEIARSHWELGLDSAVLVVAPPPEEAALPPETVEQAVAAAMEKARAQGVRGQAVTPFLLAEVSAQTGGESLRANLALLRNNARIAAQIAVLLAHKRDLLRA